MPIEITLDAENRLMRSRAWGHLVEREMWTHLEKTGALFEEGTLDESWAQIADFSAVETLGEARSDDIRRMAKGSPWPAACIRVLITPTDVLYGLGRMYQLMGGEKNANMRVVRTEAEALEFIEERRQRT